MISIRLRLTILLCLTIGALFVAAGAGVFIAMRQMLWSQFDETLTAKGRALITASEIDDGEFEIDLTVQDFAGFGTGGSDYFEIRRLDGSLFLRSPSLEVRAAGSWDFSHIPPPPDDAPLIDDGNLGDGTAARYFVQRFYPKDDYELSHKDLYLIVASPSAAMRAELLRLAWVLGVAGGMALLCLVPLIRLGLASGLRPLSELGRDLSAIRSERLDQRLDATKLPEELVSVAERLNDWLSRLEESFEREKRFSSHAAHELRTPLAELRSMAELGATWPEEVTQDRSREMLAVTDELESLLEKLSLLARADSRSLPVHVETIDLASTIDQALAREDELIRRRNLETEVRVQAGEFSGDVVIWNSIVRNLIGNAASHAPPGSKITVTAAPGRIVVSNPAPDLTAEDVSRLFDRFWRKDESRSDRGHSGLGLSIVRACASLLGGNCAAEMTADGRLEVSVACPVDFH